LSPRPAAIGKIRAMPDSGGVSTKQSNSAGRWREIQVSLPVQGEQKRLEAGIGLVRDGGDE
jgi:hypothetical protein